MNTITLGEAIARNGIDVDEHLDRDELVPVSGGLQAQGDVIVIPAELAGVRMPKDTPVEVGAGGVTLVAGIHAHTLAADEGTCRVAFLRGRGADVAVVEADAPVWLCHPEHGYLGLAPGRYLVRRQREMADAQRIVAD